MSRRQVHFIGIGGAGMAPLAELTLCRGLGVSGSDLSGNSKTSRLAALGAQITIGHNAAAVPADAEMVVYSSAVPQRNPERMRAAALGIPQLRRGEYLAHFAGNYRRVIAVNGSHGKSSITAALSSILRECGKKPGFMIGAAMHDMPMCEAGDGDIFVTEADESDATHTLLKNFIGIVANVEDDHAWSVGGVEFLEANFQQVAANSDHLIYYASERSDRLFAAHKQQLRLAETPVNFAGLQGFQAANSFIAVQAAILAGCDPQLAEQAARHSPQVARRMNTVAAADGVTVIEDYAHHPTEVRAAISWLREKYPHAHLRIVFQPHRYARLEKYFAEFVRELKKADSCFVLPVFAAWSETGRVDGAMLAAECGAEYLDVPPQQAALQIRRDLPAETVIAVLGAGDCDVLLPYLSAAARDQFS